MRSSEPQSNILVQCEYKIHPLKDEYGEDIGEINTVIAKVDDCQICKLPIKNNQCNDQLFKCTNCFNNTEDVEIKESTVDGIRTEKGVFTKNEIPTGSVVGIPKSNIYNRSLGLNLLNKEKHQDYIDKDWLKGYNKKYKANHYCFFNAPQLKCIKQADLDEKYPGIGESPAPYALGTDKIYNCMDFMTWPSLVNSIQYIEGKSITKINGKIIEEPNCLIKNSKDEKFYYLVAIRDIKKDEELISLYQWDPYIIEKKIIITENKAFSEEKANTHNIVALENVEIFDRDKNIGASDNVNIIPYENIDDIVPLENVDISNWSKTVLDGAKEKFQIMDSVEDLTSDIEVVFKITMHLPKKDNKKRKRINSTVTDIESEIIGDKKIEVIDLTND